MNKKLHPISLAVMTLLTSMAINANAQEVRHSYIVQLVGQPVAAYDGSIAGLPATKPADGTRLDISATDVQAYIAYLDKKQNDVLVAINPANVTAKYDVVLNGFAANLTDAEVRALKKNSAVLNVQADTMQQPTTSYTPSFLGLDKATGLWSKVGGKQFAGENMIIAMVDSGVWPEDLSFADKVDAAGVPTHDASGTLAYGAPPAKWKGIGCEIKPGITASNCNNKLIGIRSFVADSAPINGADFLSGRDGTQEGGGGHGSHTLSTAGGNAGVPAVLNGIPMGALSGMAPRARVAMYKTCYTGTTSTNGGCATSSSVSSINQAVKDGADVINYSIGPTAGGGTFNDPIEVAFLNASNAGVFVAASAGNSGPATNPAANLGPWHATVAASTHGRSFTAVARVAGSGDYTGASVNLNALPDTATVLSTDVGIAGYPLVYANLCFSSADGLASLDPAKVAGKIVVCTRGTTARVNKSLAVFEAGGVGMILADNGAGLVAEAHSVPTVHVNKADGVTIKNFVGAHADATSALSIASLSYVPAPVMAGFSSRGPNVADNNILKPDFTAPGVDIVAAFSASMTPGEVADLKAGGSTSSTGINMISGTSMSSPHIAGLAALIKQQHPDWNPAMIKSALMTTAGDTLPDGVTAGLPWSATALATGTLPWAQGAGHVQPNLATDPGLVYRASGLDYLRFSCALGLGFYNSATCSYYGATPDYNLNLPSMTLGGVLGVQTLTRTVTNVGTITSTYTASAAVPGYTVLVTPPSFTIAPGAKKTFTVKLTRTTAPVDTWAYGSLTWSDGIHNVRSPLTVRGKALVVPSSVYSEAATGSKVLTIGTGFSGAMSIDKAGLKAATRTTNTLTGSNQGTAATICNANTSPAVNVSNFVIPADTLVARFSLFNAETTGGQIPGGEDDLDLLILNSAGTAVAGSLNGGSNETATMLRPAAGTYKVCVISYDNQDRPGSTYTLSSWAVTKTDVGGNFKALAPATVYAGGTASVGMSWSGLPAGQRYLGAASYKVGGVDQGLTVVEVHTNDPLPLAISSRPIVVTAE